MYNEQCKLNFVMDVTKILFGQLRRRIVKIYRKYFFIVLFSSFTFYYYLVLTEHVQYTYLWSNDILSIRVCVAGIH